MRPFMSRSLQKRWLGPVPARPGGRQPGPPLWLEALEDRTVPTLFPAVLPLSGLNGSTGFTLNGLADGDNAGKAVAGAGDVNGDGLDDLLVGAYKANVAGTDRGQVYVIFGKTTPFAATFNLSALNGANGFTLN